MNTGRATLGSYCNTTFVPLPRPPCSILSPGKEWSGTKILFCFVFVITLLRYNLHDLKFTPKSVQLSDFSTFINLVLDHFPHPTKFLVSIDSQSLFPRPALGSHGFAVSGKFL